MKKTTTRISIKLFSMLLLLVMALASPIHASAAQDFHDLQHVFESVRQEIEQAASLMIIEGFGDGTFRPSEPVTVQQAVTMFLRATGIPVEWTTAMQTGIENNFIQDELVANAPMSRIKAAELIANALAHFGIDEALQESEANDLLAPFTDIDELTDAQRNSLAVTIQSGIFRGMDETTMNPNGIVNRSQMASLAVRLQQTIPLNAQEQADWEAAMNRSLDWIRSEITPGPLVGSVGGEWAVLALARANRIAANDPWLQTWFTDLEELLLEVHTLTEQGFDINHPPSVGTFPSELRRWTDFQRVSLALGALGIDASNDNGYDLTAIYQTFTPSAQRHALNQTIIADAFALIALDARNVSGDQDDFIQSILESQRVDGTWSLSPARATSALDVDVTAMVLQSIAPYYRHGDAHIDAAVGRALDWLRNQTFSDSESTAQMIVALTALGDAFADEAAYYVNHLLQWHDSTSGAFRQRASSGPVNMMATEQASYALVAYWRLVNDMAPLYDMSDVAQ